MSSRGAPKRQNQRFGFNLSNIENRALAELCAIIKNRRRRRRRHFIVRTHASALDVNLMT